METKKIGLHLKLKQGIFSNWSYPGTMKWLGNTKSKITRNGNGQNLPHLKITKLVLVHCYIFDNDYQQDSGVLYTFVPNKSFGQLLDILPENFLFLKTFNSELSCTEVWFTDQVSKHMEVEDKINLSLVIN